jgi:hypothetical protein
MVILIIILLIILYFSQSQILHGIRFVSKVTFETNIPDEVRTFEMTHSPHFNQLSVKSNVEKYTFVMGYWKINNNKKRDHKNYIKRFNNIFNVLNKLNIDIVFYYIDEEIKNKVKELNKNNIIFIKKSIENLPTYKHSLKLLNLCKKQDNSLYKKGDKGYIHYNREYLQSGEDVYRKIITIWTSKLFLVKGCIINKYFNNKYIAWHDFNIINNSIYNKLSDKIIITNSPMLYKNKRLKYQGWYIFGNNNIMISFIEKYIDELYNINNNYCHDEETIIHNVYLKYSYLFE